MRRHFRFGADGTGQRLIYSITDDWSIYSPYWISMQHKQQVFENLVRGWGASQEDSVYIQCCRFVGAGIEPALDCTAPHFPIQLEPIGATSPLPIFLLNGFIDKNFGSLPPVFKESRTLPP